MKNTSEKRAKAAAAAISSVRILKQMFDVKELVDLLKKNDCPYSAHLPAILVKEKLMERHQNMCRFTTTEPIYFGILRKPLDLVAKTSSNYVKKYKEKKVSGTTTTQIVAKETKVELPQLTTEQMITALKLQGYKVFKPVTEFKEC